MKKSFLEKNVSYIRLLKSLKPASRKKLIRKASKLDVDTISELASNILSGHISQDPSVINKFKRFKSMLRNIASKTNSKRKKIYFLASPRGGTLLGLILKAIGDFL